MSAEREAEPTPPAGATCPEVMGYAGTCGKPVKRQALPTDFIEGVAKGASPVWYCARHATMHERRRLLAEQREHNRLARERERKDQAKRNAIAANLATFLTEQLGVRLSASDGGYTLMLRVEDAQQLYDNGVILATREGGHVGPLSEWRQP